MLYDNTMHQLDKVVYTEHTLQEPQHILVQGGTVLNRIDYGGSIVDFFFVFSRNTLCQCLQQQKNCHY